jgi:hypothetical protein
MLCNAGNLLEKDGVVASLFVICWWCRTGRAHDLLKDGIVCLMNGLVETYLGRWDRPMDHEVRSLKQKREQRTEH